MGRLAKRLEGMTEFDDITITILPIVEGGEPRSQTACATSPWNSSMNMGYGPEFGAFWISSSVMVAARPSTCAGARSNARRSFAREIVARGHEPASHGYRWVCHAHFKDYETEKVELQKASEAIERVTGERPLGFYSMWGPSLDTRRILQELGFVYRTYERTVRAGEIA